VPGSEGSKPSVKALRALAAMWMLLRHGPNPGTAPCIAYKICADVRREPSDDFCFGCPDERIVDTKIAAKQLRQQIGEASQGLWMCGSRRSGSNHLGSWRKVEADDTVFEEPDAVAIEESRSYRT